MKRGVIIMRLNNAEYIEVEKILAGVRTDLGISVREIMQEEMNEKAFFAFLQRTA